MDKGVASKLDKFFGQYRIRSYPKGQILILNGDPAEYIYQLVKGRVKEYGITHRGDEIVLNIFKPPAFFPMSLAINKNDNPYVYEAETDIEIRQAPPDRTIVFLKDNPDVMFDLIGRLYRGIDGLLGRMSHLMASGAKARMIYEILLACRRHGERKADGAYVVALNETDLAARAGLSRETVSREMNKLGQQKLLKIGGGQITVHDINQLESKLDNTP